MWFAICATCDYSKNNIQCKLIKKIWHQAFTKVTQFNKNWLPWTELAQSVLQPYQCRALRNQEPSEFGRSIAQLKPPFLTKNPQIYRKDSVHAVQFLLWRFPMHALWKLEHKVIILYKVIEIMVGVDMHA